MATVKYFFLFLTNVTYKKDRQCTYKRYVEARFCNHLCCGKAV